jgi:hypothetical protein
LNLNLYLYISSAAIKERHAKAVPSFAPVITEGSDAGNNTCVYNLIFVAPKLAQLSNK